MKLYYVPHTCSLSPHIVLRELGLPFELIRVNNQTKQLPGGQDFRRINLKGYVAALEIESGEILTEGPAILQYLADLVPEKGLAPEPGTWERVRLQEGLNFISSEIHASSAPLFNSALPDAAKAIFRDKLFTRLDLLETTLGGQRYVLGGSFSVADAYLFTVLGWCKFFEIGLGRWPSISNYQDRIGSRTAVRQAMQAETAELTSRVANG